jgi:hypothetical protein
VRDVDGGRIHLEDGRTLPANYHEFDHGYAITAHRSQGKTVDAVILSADAMKQELFYVAASRGREGITVITSDVDRLRESLGISSARPSALQRLCDRCWRCFGTACKPILMLKMSEFFRHGDIDELVERNAFFQREILRNPTHRGHEPERKFVHDNLLLACGHTLISSS